MSERALCRLVVAVGHLQHGDLTRWMRRIELEGVPRSGESVTTREGLSFVILNVERLECGDEPALARTPRVNLHAQKPKESNGLADRLAANGWIKLEDITP